MRVVRIKKWYLTVASVMLALFVILGLGISNAPAASADPCAAGQVKVVVVGSGLSVCVPSGALPTITVTLPRVTSTVTLPRVTQTSVVTRVVNGKKITATVSVPGPVRTVTRNGTVTKPVSTRTVTVNRGLVGDTTRQTVTQRATLTKASTVTSTVTVTSPPKTVIDKDDVVVTKVKAATISVLLLIMGGIIALLMLRAAYTYGWIRGDGGNRAFIREVKDELRFRD